MLRNQLAILTISADSSCFNHSLYFFFLVFQSVAADYDQVPIEAYGFAMLRGMGWKEGIGIGKKGR